MDKYTATSLAIVFFVILLGAASAHMDSVEPESPVQEPATEVEEVPKETQTVYPDWTLSIPSIDFSQQMTQISKVGTELPVPDGHPGYYSENEGNLFIVGHNNSVFPRLGELPSEIFIYHNNLPTHYTLVNNAIMTVDSVSMDSLLTYQGVVIMTCAGEKIGDTYSHRLILYYN